MNLRYITCSDPREHTSLQDIVNLAKLPNAEIAVQCHPSKMSAGMPRNVWFNNLVSLAFHVDMKLAMHINMEWADSICAHGQLPSVICNWMVLKHDNNSPVIKRIQLNMPKTTAENINANALAEIIRDFPNQEFILQYNNNTKGAIEKLHQTGVKFSLLFDASGGRGLAPKEWRGPIYKEHPMGYSGGISPDNVVENLNKINTVVPQNREIWIDAEGKLKSPQQLPDGTYKDLFDVNKAREYVKRANAWKNQR